MPDRKFCTFMKLYGRAFVCFLRKIFFFFSCSFVRFSNVWRCFIYFLSCLFVFAKKKHKRIFLVYIWEEIFIYIHPYTGGMSLGKRENIESHTIRYDHYFKTTDSFLICAGWSIHCYPGIVLRQGIRSNTLY